MPAECFPDHFSQPKALFTSHVANFYKFNRPIIHALLKNNWRVDYASCGEETIEDCCKHFTISFARQPFSLQNLRAFFQLRRLLKKERYDLIHCHTPVGGVITRLAAASLPHYPAKVVYTAHGFHFYKGAPIRNWLLYYPVERALSYYTDCLITINKEDYIRAKSKHFGAHFIEKTPGVGIDLSLFSPRDNQVRLSMREQLDVPFDGFVLLYIAEFIPRKNQTLLLDVFEKLCKIDTRFWLILAGQGVDFSERQAQAVRLGICDRCKFLGYRKDVASLCAAADVAVSTSSQEGLPVFLLEAMACGLPVVCANIRGQSDLFANRGGGLLYPVGDGNTLEQCILQLQRNPSLVSTMRQQNLQDIPRFSQIKVIKQLLSIYQKLGLPIIKEEV